MAHGANVPKVEAIQKFRDALATFCSQALDALSSAQMEARRTADWIANDRRFHWERELTKRWDELAEAKAALARKEMGDKPNHRVDTTEEKKNLRRAKLRLEEAESKLEAVKKWSRLVVKAIEEYEGQARRLAEVVEGNPPQNVIALDKILAALDAYLHLAPPPGGEETR